MGTSDVLMVQTADDGDILVEGGVVARAAGLETAVYLSLFGGNEADSGAENDPRGWWGNVGSRDPQRSETQYLLQSLPATSGNLLRLTDAVKRDLAWLKTHGAATEIIAAVSIPSYNHVNIRATIDNVNYNFTETWSAKK